MKLNLFDDTFRHDVCSVAGKTPRHVQYERDLWDWDGVTLFVDGYVRSSIVDSVRSRVKIAWLHEPRCLHPENYENIPADRFDRILTYCPDLVAQYPNAVYAPYGGVWIPRQFWRAWPKTKLCSMLVGAKMQTEGHRIRHKIADAVDGLVDFYGVRGRPVDYGWPTKMLVLQDYAFSIVCECCHEPGLFTEILLDCFAAGTIPVFWGDPTIGERFNADGVLAFDTVQTAEWIARHLSMDLYHQLLPAVRDNQERIREYEVTEDWLYEHVLREYE